MTVPATLRRMGKPKILIVTTQISETVLLMTYSHIMRLSATSTKRLPMKMENTGRSGKYLEFSIHHQDTKIGGVANIMYRYYGRLERSLLIHLISLQKIFLLNLHNMQLKTVYWISQDGDVLNARKGNKSKLNASSVKPNSDLIASVPNTNMDLKYHVITNMQWNLTSEMATPYDPMQIPLNMENYANMMFSLIILLKSLSYLFIHW